MFSDRNQILNTKKQPLKTGIFLAGCFSVVVFALFHFLSNEASLPYTKEMRRAAGIMDDAISAIREFKKSAGFDIDEIVDPNRTGLIGREYTELTTTLGDLTAKRTTTNPNFAALIVHLLHKLDVVPGDTIGVGCSASFPALMIASLAAAKATDVFPIVMMSLGSSSFGANDPDFNLLHIYDVLLEEGITDIEPAAISLGGADDVGEEFSSELKDRLIEQIRRSNNRFIHEPDFQKNVAKRMKLYLPDSTRNRIAAFINIGGSYTNMGQNESVLQLNPGIVETNKLPKNSESGVIFKMLRAGVPVIHLLYIKEFVLKYGLSWDPVPLPAPGDENLRDRQSKPNAKFWAISLCYFLGIGLIIYWTWIQKRKQQPTQPT